MKPSIPDRLKIGPHIYELRVTPGLGGELEPPHAVWGLYHSAEQLIEIDGDAVGRPVVLAEAILHEAIHGLCKHHALSFAEDEDTVRRVGLGLMQLLIDNPALRKIIEHAAKHVASAGPEPG